MGRRDLANDADHLVDLGIGAGAARRGNDERNLALPRGLQHQRDVADIGVARHDRLAEAEQVGPGVGRAGIDDHGGDAAEIADGTHVLVNTAVWVAAVVSVSVIVSLGLAQLLNESFPGRGLVRAALIVPWAASLIMTSKLFVWIYDYYFGILNHVLVSLRLVPAP